MREIDIDISSQCSKSLDEFREKKFDYVITLCDNSRESCPFFPHAYNILHKGFSDPAQHQGTAEETLLAFRQIRDEIALWIQQAFQPDGIKINER
jgi:arsenate reductase